jgi:hypothetical protein
MAITTLDGVRAGLMPPVDFFKAQSAGEAAGVPYSTFYTAGLPEAAAAPSPGLSGTALTSYAGQIPFQNPVSGNAYLARYDGFMLALASSNVMVQNILLDRLWHNSGIDVTNTGAQTITSATWPARDRNGSTNGDGVFVGIEVSTATTNGSPVTTITMSYTNSAGTSGRTGTIASFPATAVAGTFVLFQLDAGDIGVRSVESITLGTTLSAGAIHLVAVRPICDLPQKAGGEIILQDAFACGFPRLYDNTVPFIAQASSSTNVGGGLTVGFAHG